MTIKTRTALIDDGKKFREIQIKEFETLGGSRFVLIGKTVVYHREDGYKRSYPFPSKDKAEAYFLKEFDLLSE